MASYRRKNRQLKVTFDVPDEYESDEDFMEFLMDKLDDPMTGVGWKVADLPIKKILMGGIEIAPEED